MSKKERRTLVALMALGITVSLILIICRYAQTSSTQASTSSEPVFFSAGSTVVLDSNSEDLRSITSDGSEVTIDFGWDGIMALSIESAILYKGARASDIASELGAYLHKDDDRILLVTCRLKNISAVPTTTDHTGSASFSAGIFSIPGLECRYFSATSADPGAHEYLSFNLDRGDEIEFTLGYPWQSTNNGALGSIPEVMTPGISGTQGHYQIQLGTTVEE